MTNISLTGFDLLSHALSRSQFESNREQNKHKYAGSGFIEWGRTAVSTVATAINEGMWTYTLLPNIIIIGTNDTNTDVNTHSKTRRPVVNVGGMVLTIESSEYAVQESIIKFPDAPDGLTTFDSSTGASVTHTDAATAFAAETSTNKVVVSRTDLLGLEVWTERLDNLDIVYPFGNVQFGLPTYKGITLSDSLVVQTYSSASFAGQGARWSTLTDAQKRLFTSNPENNLYYDTNGDFYQVRYRLRVSIGRNDDWSYVEETTPGSLNAAIVGGTTAGGYLSIQGKRTVDPHIDTDGQTWAYTYENPSSNKEIGTLGNKYSTCSDTSESFYMPICLVARRNQGAYHPDYNPNGAACFHQSGVAHWQWWQDFSTWKTVSSTVDCFTGMVSIPGPIGTSGYTPPGSKGQPDEKAYDVIYATDVKDLRVSAHLVYDYSRLLDQYWNKAQEGTLRGWGNNTRIVTTTATVTVSSTSLYQSTNTGGSLSFGTSASTYPRDTTTQTLSQVNTLAWILTGDNGERMVLPRYSGTTGDFIYWPYTDNKGWLYGLGASNNHTTEFNSKFPIGTVLHIGSLIQDKVTPKGDAFIACDVIGNHANFPARWFTVGMPGILIGDTDGVNRTNVLSRKRVSGSTALLVLYSTDNGVTWNSTYTAAFNSVWDESLNGFPLTGGAVGSLYLVFYEAEAPVFNEGWDFTRLSVLGQASHIDEWDASNGGLLCHEALGFPSSGTTNKSIALSNYAYYQPLTLQGATQIPYTDMSGTDVSAAARFLPVLGTRRRKAKLGIMYNQIKTGTDAPPQIQLSQNRRDLVADLGTAPIAVGSMSITLPHFINDSE